MAAFLDLLSFRECCYRCKYAYSARQSDITIGDFWGLGNLGMSKFNSKEGVSAILIISERGQQLYDLSKNFLNVEEREIQEAIAGNSQLKSPSKRNFLRNKFENLYKTNGFTEAVKSTTIRNNQFRRFFQIPGKIMTKLASVINIQM